MLQDKNGAEYFLYHIYPGETCAISLSCCISRRVSEVKAVAEDDMEILFIPVESTEEWMRFPEWKKFVSDTQALRFSELLETIGLIAFSKMDEQLWNYLMRKVQATGNRVLFITHQEIAAELNSPREVVTRLLHKLQEQKKVVLSRNKIEVVQL
jgi:CRP/FNR family transcriptional regulator